MVFAQSTAVYSNYSLKYTIEDLGRMGYKGIEIWSGRPHMYHNDFSDDIDAIHAVLRRYGMKVTSVLPALIGYPYSLCSENESIRKDSVLHIKKVMDNAVNLLSPYASICPGMVLFDGDITNGRKQMLKSLEEIAEYAEKIQITALLEPAHIFESNIGTTTADCIRLLKKVPSPRLGLLIDTGHMNINKENFYKTLEDVKEFPMHVHINDNFGQHDQHLIPGEGNIDFKAFACALHKVGYNGNITCELSGIYNMSPLDACKKSFEVMESLFGKQDDVL